ncbi:MULTISPECIES: glycosyltransferase family 2 protein [Helicobacter]|uniref:glycosyltransferase family 2 protein n=2 Tax=Helicobacter TaxID=209 RepID=UPI0026282EEE|nr:glycosyltransferase [Helicobacter sp. UBA3407]
MSQTKKVAIIIPIYNVEKFLNECLDSIVNQTYTNLEILLINDGSTDSSLQIAKEYAQKDSRITIIDKANGGQANARNAGIEFFSGEIFYHCKVADCHSENKACNGKEKESLCSYKIIGENLYQIHTIYSLKNPLEIPQIDYLQFVDSDDYIELDCVEQCVKRMWGVEVLWFDAETLLDGVKKSDWKSNLHFFNYNKEVVISRKDWAIRLFERILAFFYFSWSGMINFNFLKKIKLKFINGIIQEDDMFGILLFAQSSFIYVYPKKLYHYRIRANSTMNYSNDFQAKVAGFFAKSAEVFKDNYSKRAYHKASSFMQTSLALENFLQNTQDERLKHICATYLMPTYVFYAHKILYFSQDPLNLIPEFQKLEKYLKGFKNNALVNDLLKEELTYRLGSVSLSLLKNPKKLLSLPKILYSIIQRDKESQKTYKENSKTYPLPNFKNLASKASVIKIKQHLSYKLGNCILNAHKMRYFGGYLWLPFGLIWTLICFKLSHSKRELNSVFFSSMDKLNREISHLSWQIYSAKDTGANSSDFLAYLQGLSEFADIFIQAKDKLVLSYTKDAKLLDLLLECKSDIHHFEADLAFCEILKSKYQESKITFYNNALSCVESTQICQRENQGSGICPSVFYANHHLYEAKGLKIAEVLQRFPNLYLLVLDLDFETCAILEELLESKAYQKISYIFCKVDRIFGESKKFESLKKRIDSTPAAQFVFCVKLGAKDE